MRKRLCWAVVLLLFMAGCSAPQEQAALPSAVPSFSAAPSTPEPYTFGLSFEAETTASPVPTPSPTPAPTPVPFLGRFTADTGYGTLTVYLSDGGEAVLSYGADSHPGTWKYESDSILVSSHGQTAEFSFSPSFLFYAAGEMTLALEKEKNA